MINIQLAEKYKNAEKGEKERMFWGSRSRGSREEGHLEPGLERGRTFGAGARERKDIWSRGSRGVGAGAREKRDAVRNMSMKRRRD